MQSLCNTVTSQFTLKACCLVSNMYRGQARVSVRHCHSKKKHVVTLNYTIFLNCVCVDVPVSFLVSTSVQIITFIASDVQLMFL